MTTMRQAGHRAPPSGSWLGRAWGSVALIPVLFFGSFALGYVLYDALGYQAEDNDAPLWVDVVVAVAVLAVAVAPCVAAVLYGRRAWRGGERQGLLPLGIGAVVGAGLTVLTVVTTVADAVA